MVENRSMVACWESRGVERKKLPSDIREHLGVMEVLIILTAVIIPGVYTYVKTYQTVHFKHRHWIVCWLCFNKPVKIMWQKWKPVSCAKTLVGESKYVRLERNKDWPLADNSWEMGTGGYRYPVLSYLVFEVSHNEIYKLL